MRASASNMRYIPFLAAYSKCVHIKTYKRKNVADLSIFSFWVQFSLYFHVLQTEFSQVLKHNTRLQNNNISTIIQQIYAIVYVSIPTPKLY